MAALTTEVQNRFSVQKLVELTNPDLPSATAINATVLANACTDAQNAFADKTGVTFDQTQASHVTVAVDGVIWFLHKYRGLPGAQPEQSAKAAFDAACAAFARTRGALTWLAPTTDSTYTPTPDSTLDRSGLPYFDGARLTDYVPPAPAQNNKFDTTFPNT